MRMLLLTARDPLTVADGTAPARMAQELATAGHEVVLVLLEDAVVLARAAHRDTRSLAEAIDAGVQVLADEEAMARRAVARSGDGIKPAGLGEVVDLLLDWSDRQAWL